MNRLRRAFTSLGVGRLLGLAMLLAFVALRVWDPGPLEVLRLKTFDFYQVVKPREAQPVPVAIIDIDEESLNEIGQWPWPRTKLAQLVNRAANLGAVVIGFDMIFAEKDRLSPNLLVEHFPNLDPVTQRRIAQLPENDQTFAHAMQRFRVVVGQSGYHRALEHSAEDPIRAPPLATVGGDPLPFMLGYPGIVRNLPPIENAAAGHAVLTIKPENDGIVRRVPGVLSIDGKVMPTLAIELLRVATGSGPLVVKSNEVGITSLVVAGAEVPTDERGRLWIHFAPHDPARFVPAKDILTGTVDPARIAGHILLVGTSAVGLFDLKATPIDPVMPGVEVHAQVIETILTRSTLSRPGFAVGAEVIMAIAMGLAIIAILPIFRAWVVLVIGALIAIILGQVSWYFYSNKHMLIDVAYPMASSFAIYWAMMFLNYFREEVERRKIRGAFGQYISPALVEELARSPEKLVLGGETKNMTILFTDVRGFTTISEQYKTNPQGLTSLMNRLLTPLSNEIIRNNGTIDKYMGDAIMAFWNAPIDDAEHAREACEAALAMLERLAELNVERRAEAEEAGMEFLELDAGIGINTGDCVVGNMGSDMRFDYSVLGDTVNLASRLEGQSKTYSVRIVLGAATAELVGDEYTLVELDLIRVKGKREPERIHALLGRRDDAGAKAHKAFAETFGQVLELYRGRNWTGALKTIREAKAEAEALDLGGLLDLYRARVQAFKKVPPPKSWDGVFTASTK